MRIYKVARRSPGRANRLSVVTGVARVSQLHRWIVSRYPIQPVGVRPRWILAVLIKFHSELDDWTELAERSRIKRVASVNSLSNVSLGLVYSSLKDSIFKGIRCARYSRNPRFDMASLFSGKHTFHNRLNIYRLSTRNFNTILDYPVIVYIYEIDYQSDKWKVLPTALRIEILIAF